MNRREEKRNLETIPVGSLGLIPMQGCKSLGEKVDYYLVKWRIYYLLGCAWAFFIWMYYWTFKTKIVLVSYCKF